MANETVRSTSWAITFGAVPRQRKNVYEQIMWMQSAASGRKRLPPEFHEVWFALAEELRRVADVHEHAAMLDLHEGRGKGWQQVGAALGVSKTRQALQQRWKQLSAKVGPDAGARARGRSERLDRGSDARPSSPAS